MAIDGNTTCAVPGCIAPVSGRPISARGTGPGITVRAGSKKPSSNSNRNTKEKTMWDLETIIRMNNRGAQLPGTVVRTDSSNAVKTETDTQQDLGTRCNGLEKECNVTNLSADLAEARERIKLLEMCVRRLEKSWGLKSPFLEDQE
jgi:hypothetical protein